MKYRRNMDIPNFCLDFKQDTEREQKETKPRAISKEKYSNKCNLKQNRTRRNPWDWQSWDWCYTAKNLTFSHLVLFFVFPELLRQTNKALYFRSFCEYPRTLTSKNRERGIKPRHDWRGFRVSVSLYYKTIFSYVCIIYVKEGIYVLNADMYLR